MIFPRQIGRLVIAAATARVSLVHLVRELWDIREIVAPKPQQWRRRTEVWWPPGRRRCYCVSITLVCKVFARTAAGAVGCSEGETGWRLCHDEPREVMAVRVGKSPGSRDPDSCDSGRVT
jgi:hypothetical protein